MNSVEVNKAFDKLVEQIREYYKACWQNGSPVKRLVVVGNDKGWPIKIKADYHKKNETPV